MDIAVNDKPVGTIFIQLFNETVPITAENFRLLATGNINFRVNYHIRSYLHEILLIDMKNYNINATTLLKQ